jgi:hypothetical protein
MTIFQIKTLVES